ncbi:Probable anion transporter 4, chloroplastic [Linum perenne]
MSSSFCSLRPPLPSPLPSSKHRRILNSQGLISSPLEHFPLSRSVGSSTRNSILQFKLRGRHSLQLRSVSSSSRLSASKDGADFDFLPDGSIEPLKPSFREFITSERVKVVAMLALALALCNADRVVMSVAIVPLSLSNGWSRSFSGIVQSSFLWGYLISPIPGGTLVDYYGGKVVMGWGVALWSLATFLTPWAAETSLWALLAMRAMLGIAEGVALPCMNNMVLDYIQRGSKKQKSTPAKEQPKTKWMLPPFGRLLSKMPTWSLIVANAMHSWGFFVILSWMPIYFNYIYHVDLKHAAWFSAVPWSVMAFMGYVGGLWSDVLIRGGVTVTLTRKIMQSIGFMGPAVALVGLTTAKSPSIASAWLTLAVALKSFSHSGFLVNFQVGLELDSKVARMSNTAGTLAAIVGTVGAGYFVDLTGSFRGFLLLTSALYFLSAVFYIIFSTGERVDFDQTATV